LCCVVIPNTLVETVSNSHHDLPFSKQHDTATTIAALRTEYWWEIRI